MMTIILRELHDSIKSFGFAVLLLLSITLFLINALVFIPRYRDALKEYSQRITFLHSVRSTRTMGARKHPGPLMFLAEGGQSYLTKEYWIYPGGKIEPWPYHTPPETSAMPDVPELDWTFIITGVFSLYALFLGYNALSGERERGTLRLIMSNPCARTRILAAKYCSIFIMLLIPLFAGVSLNLGFISSTMPKVLSTAPLAAYPILLLAVVAYLSLFIFLSLLVSSVEKESSVSLLVLLLVWVVFTIIPDMSGIIADKIHGGGSEYTLAKTSITSERYEIWGELKTALQTRIDRGDLKTEEEINKAYTSEVIKIVREIARNRQAYEQFLVRKADVSRMMSRISPMALFRNAAEAIAGTGDGGEENFMRDMKRFSWEYDRYIEKKLGTVIPDSEAGGITVRFGGKEIAMTPPEPREFDGNKSDFPVFRESVSSLPRILSDSLPDLSGLLLWNLVLAMGAFLSFNRADVR